MFTHSDRLSWKRHLRRSGVHGSISLELSLACICNTCVMYRYAMYRRLTCVSGPSGNWGAMLSSPQYWLTLGGVFEQDTHPVWHTPVTAPQWHHPDAMHERVQ